MVSLMLPPVVGSGAVSEASAVALPAPANTVWLDCSTP